MTSGRHSSPLRVGFVPLYDAAPFLLARELGLYAKHGIEVVLSREPGWATIRDKIAYGELDAAHALAPMPMALSLDLGAPPVPCVTGLVLSLHGNAITVSRKLAEAGVKDAGSLKEYAEKLGRPLILGIPFLHSSHAFLLRDWLGDALRYVRLVVVPPPQMPVNLKEGHLDGYCVGEPWGVASVLGNAGATIARSVDIAPGHPEKVLLATRQFAEERAEEHERLIAALVEACEFCEASRNRDRVIEVLSRKENVGLSMTTLRHAFGESLFHGYDANVPDVVKARWLLAGLREALSELPHLDWRGAEASFRPDIYARALALRPASVPKKKRKSTPIAIPA